MSRGNPGPAEGAERVYEIHEVARLTGLSPARLRAWERRHAVVRPERQPNGYRAYTGDQVALLRAFARRVEAGARIGDLAEQSIDELLGRPVEREMDTTPHAALLDAAVALDRDRLETLVAQQLALRGVGAFGRDVALPLEQEVADLQALGRLSAGAGHLAREVVVHALKGALRMTRRNGPLCVASCIAGDWNEWRFLADLTGPQEQGWQVHYFGPDLPVDDLVEAAWRRQADAAILGAADPASVEAQLPALSGMAARLPPRTAAIIAGSGVEPFERTLRLFGFQLGLDSVTIGDERSFA